MRDEAEGDFDLDERTERGAGIWYVTSLHQHPTGTHLPLDRRSILLLLPLLLFHNNSSTTFLQHSFTTTRSFQTLLPQSWSELLLLLPSTCSQLNPVIILIINPRISSSTSAASISFFLPPFLHLPSFLVREKHDLSLRCFDMLSSRPRRQHYSVQLHTHKNTHTHTKTKFLAPHTNTTTAHKSDEREREESERERERERKTTKRKPKAHKTVIKLYGMQSTRWVFTDFLVQRKEGGRRRGGEGRGGWGGGRGGECALCR